MYGMNAAQVELVTSPQASVVKVRKTTLERNMQDLMSRIKEKEQSIDQMKEVLIPILGKVYISR